MSRKRPRPPENVPDLDDGPSEVGIIEKIHMENFMNLTNSLVTFGRHINLLTGPNGSGKSATMTALQVALGASAHAVGRAASNKGLVNDAIGVSTATVRVTLRNRGLDAYEPEKYGDSITIERRIEKEGGGHYRLKSATGHVVATKYQDVQALLAHYNILIENPCNCLTQTMSSEFLRNSDPKKLYEFFHNGTQLNKVLDMLSQLRQIINDTINGMSVKCKQLQRQRVEVEELEGQLTSAKQLTQWQERLGFLYVERAWTVVRDEAEKIETERQALLKVEADVQKYEQAIKEIEEKLKMVEEDRMKMTNELTESTNDCNKAMDELKEAAQHVAQARQGTSKVTKSIQLYKKNHAMLISDIRRLEEMIDQERSKVNEDTEAEERDLMTKKQAIEEQKHEAANVLREAQQNLDRAGEQASTLRNEEQEAKDKISEVQYREREIQRRIRDLTGSRNARVNIYGEWMGGFIKELLRHASHFERMPIGPLGLLIKLKDSKWVNAVELAINQSLSAFICHSPADAHTFNSIAGQVLPAQHASKISLFKMEHTQRKYDTPRVPEQYTLVADQIEVDREALQNYFGGALDPMTVATTIYNTLCDWHTIEKVIVMEDRAQAQDTIFGQRIPGISQCNLIDGSSVTRRGRSEVTHLRPRPARKLSSGQDPSAEIASLKGQEPELKHLLAHYQDRHKDRANARQKADSAKQKAQGDYQAAKRRHVMLAREADDIQRDMEQIQQTQQQQGEDEMIQEWTNQIQSKQTQMQEIEGKIQEAEASISEHTEAISGLEQGHEAKKQRQLEAKRVTESLQQSLQDLVDNQLMSMERSLQKSKSKKASKETECETIKASTARQESMVEQAKGVASSIGEPVPTERSQDQVAKEMSKLEGQINKYQKKLVGKSAAQVEKEYKDKLKMYNANFGAYKTVKETLDSFEESLKKRTRGWVKMQKQCQRACGLRFNNVLTNKGHSGTLEFKNDAREMYPILQLDSLTKESGTAQVSNLKTLSGGEKSFTTIALLLSMWPVAEAPFRFVDEYDVNMDESYRKKSTDLLMRVCTKAENKTYQYIFSTPLSINHMASDPNVHVITLPDPKKRPANQPLIHEAMGGQ